MARKPNVTGTVSLILRFVVTRFGYAIITIGALGVMQVIKFRPIGIDNLWQGTDWAITDEDGLAQLIARVALGQYRHVLQVLQQTNCAKWAPSSTALDGAIRLLTADDLSKPWHRDGWLFQVISWIAASIQHPSVLKSPPHMLHAHKGFDGVHLHLDDSGRCVVRVVVCEEKATGKPRKMITSKVWPEFRSLESGERDNELVAETSTLLARHGYIDADQAVTEILWKKTRAYRVSITIGESERSVAGRKALFKGYKKTAPGSDVVKRRAETLFRKDLRQWMSKIAAKSIDAAKQIEASDV